MTDEAYPLPPATNDCKTLECRQRKAKRIARFAPMNDAVSSLEAYERIAARQALRRYSRQVLTEGELLAEVEALERQITYLNMFEPTEKQIEALRWYQREHEDTVDRLDRLTRRSITNHYPRHTTKPDFDKARHVDLVGLVETLTAQAGFKSGSRYIFRCPWHTDKTPSLVVYPPGKGWHCFSCKEGGSDAASFVARYRDVSQVEALRIVEEMCDV